MEGATFRFVSMLTILGTLSSPRNRRRRRRRTRAGQA
jgi:hypothetical protein